jgi:hypothetical protein
LNIENVKEGSKQRQFRNPKEVLRIHEETFREKEHPSGMLAAIKSNESINKKI